MEVEKSLGIPLTCVLVVQHTEYSGLDCAARGPRCLFRVCVCESSWVEQSTWKPFAES